MSAGLVALSTGEWIGIGVGGSLFIVVLWTVLFFFLGLKALRRGHWVMFLLGWILPIFWIIGALIPARR